MIGHSKNETKIAVWSTNVCLDLDGRTARLICRLLPPVKNICPINAALSLTRLFQPAAVISAGCSDRHLSERAVSGGELVRPSTELLQHLPGLRGSRPAHSHQANQALTGPASPCGVRARRTLAQYAPERSKYLQ